MKEVEELYQEIISSFDIVTTESHVSRFADSLVAAFDNLEKRTVQTKVVVCFKSTVDKYIGESINDAGDFIKAAQKIVILLRKVMEEKNNSFDGYFEEGCQLKSVPIQLLTVSPRVLAQNGGQPGHN